MLKFTVNNPKVDKVVIKVLDKDRFGVRALPLVPRERLLHHHWRC